MADTDVDYALDITNHVPKKEAKDGVLYVDGVPVEKWQLTTDELREFFPEEYEKQYGGSTRECPVAGCGKRLQFENKVSWSGHTRLAHVAWYERNRPKMDKCETFEAFCQLVKET